MKNKKRLIIGIAALAVALAGMFLWKEFGTTDALAVGQLSSLGDSPEGHWIQVRGRVEGNSLRWDAQSRRAEFALIDGQDRVAVVYQGTLPDSFKPGAEIVVEGRHLSGRFEAYGFVTKSLCNLCHA